MSNLRQKKRNPFIEEDIEAPIAPEKHDAAASPSAASFTPVTGSSRRSSNNPAVLAGMVLRKVVALLTSDDDHGDITTAGGVIALLKDIMMGIMLGMAGVSMFIFLDHKDVIHLQSAHNYRNAAFAMVQDPETRALIEESSGLIFMGLKSHETQVKEIAAFPGKIKVREEKIIMLGGDLEVAKKEHAAIKPGYDILALDPALGLDKFCGECSWNGGTNCDTRLTYLMTTYNLQTIKAKLELMKSTPQCVRKV
jgi:hypothetical protein